MMMESKKETENRKPLVPSYCIPGIQYIDSILSPAPAQSQRNTEKWTKPKSVDVSLKLFEILWSQILK